MCVGLLILGVPEKKTKSIFKNPHGSSQLEPGPSYLEPHVESDSKLPPNLVAKAGNLMENFRLGEFLTAIPWSAIQSHYSSRIESIRIIPRSDSNMPLPREPGDLTKLQARGMRKSRPTMSNPTGFV